MLSSSFRFTLFFVLSISNLYSQTLSIITDKNHPYKDCIQLENLPTDPFQKEDLQVFLFPQSPDSKVPSIVGKSTIDNHNLYFCPLIPFSKNLTYQARFPNVPYFTFKPVPKENYTLTTLIDLYPTTEELPENLLKMYLYFSAPMSDGNGYQYLHLENEKGEKITAPFLELTPLLWNEDRTRLTLWFDPGRVKRDLLRNQKLGAPLEEGKNYTLRISKNWKDANGYSLANDFVKKISVVKADRTAPNPKNWKVQYPKTNTKNAIIIHFGESLDHALAANSLVILNKKGKKIAGNIQLQNDDKTWTFIPLNNWKPDTYQIKIKGALEDLAGNNLNRLFDTNLEEQTAPKRDLSYYYLDFNVN